MLYKDIKKTDKWNQKLAKFITVEGTRPIVIANFDDDICCSHRYSNADAIVFVYKKQVFIGIEYKKRNRNRNTTVFPSSNE